MSDYLVNPGNAGNITGDLGTLFTDDNTQYRSNVMGSNGGAGVKNMIIASTDATGNVNIGMNEPTLDAGTATIPIDNLTIVTGAVFSPQSGKIAVKETLKMSGGLIGKSAYTFDGSSGYISAGDSADGTYGNRNIFAGGGTVEIWFNAASHGENTAGRLIQKTRTIGSDVGWRLNMDGSNKLYFRQDFSSAAGIWKTPASTVVFGKWHHFAVTYDNGDVANDPTFYLDGKVIAAEEDNTPVGSYESDSGQGMYIGNQDFNSGNTFDGTIAMVRIFTDIRTQAELRTDMFNNKAGMSSTHLLARMYQFDEGTGAALENVADAAGTTGDATISGSAWAAAGTFTPGTSTLKMTGASKNINYTGDETIGHLHIDAGQTTLNNLSVTDGTDTFTCSSVTIDSGTTFTTTSGTTTITSEDSGTGVAWNNTGGTFTHNNGLVKFTTPAGTVMVENTWYDFEMDADASTREYDIRDTSGNAITILGNLTVTEGRLTSLTTSDAITIHGLTNVAANGTCWHDADQDTNKIIHNGLVTNLGTYKINDGTTVKLNGGIRQLGTLTIA